MTPSDGVPEAGLLNALSATFPDGPPSRIGVAVSGGGDSMALLHLALRVFPQHVLALTVDHGLRQESAAEAAQVAAFCAANGVSHLTLRWHGPAPTGNLMAQARQARIDLMAAWARGRGVSDILLGHTADDQAETFLMTLARAAGLDGLSGLRPQFQAQGIAFHRPLLQVTRAALRSYLAAEGVGWVDDPTNEDDRFARARSRKALAALAPLGLDAGTIAHSVRNLAMARHALQASVADIARRHVGELAGSLQVDGEVLDGLADDLHRRLLIGALRWIAGASHPPREAQLDRLRARLAGRQEATLGGVRFFWAKDRLTMAREGRALGGTVAQAGIWDGRWVLQGPAVQGATLGPLGAKGLRQCPEWRRHGPAAVLATTPALWAGEALVAAPLAGVGAGYTARLPQPFAEFILSH